MEMNGITVNQMIGLLQKLVEEDSTIGELPVYQQSCFDEPYTYNSTNVYVGKVFIPYDDGGHNCVLDKSDCDGNLSRYETSSAVIIESF